MNFDSPSKANICAKNWRMNQSNMQIDLKNIEGIKNLVDEGGYDIEQIL